MIYHSTKIPKIRESKHRIELSLNPMVLSLAPSVERTAVTHDGVERKGIFWKGFRISCDDLSVRP